MRYLGIDYGSKKIGLAFSDETGTMAFPHSVVKNDGNFLKTLEALLSREHFDEIVIGHSLDKSGNENEIQAAINELITDITLHIGVPVHLEPELYSTQEATRIQGKDKHTDAAAAAIILNSHLTRRK